MRIAADERFVICCNPEGAERDAAVRARMIAQLKELIDGTDALSKDKRAELRGIISTNRIQVGTFTGPADTFRQRTKISPDQAAILEQLGIDPPPRIYQLIPAVSR